VPAAHGSHRKFDTDPEGVDGPACRSPRLHKNAAPASDTPSPLQGRRDKRIVNRGRRAQKPCPCPRLLNFHPCGVQGTVQSRFPHPPCPAEDMGKDQPQGRGIEIRIQPSPRGEGARRRRAGEGSFSTRSDFEGTLIATQLANGIARSHDNVRSDMGGF